MDTRIASVFGVLLTTAVLFILVFCQVMVNTVSKDQAFVLAVLALGWVAVSCYALSVLARGQSDS